VHARLEQAELSGQGIDRESAVVDAGATRWAWAEVGTVAAGVRAHPADIGDDLNLTDLWPIIKHLRRFGIFYAKPLDLDYIMLARFSAAYTKLEPGETGPRTAEAARLEADEQVAEGMRRRADEFPGSSASPSPS
jgi:hypothetical protein